MQIKDEIKGIKSTYTIKTIVKHNEYSNIKLGIDQKTHKEVAIKIYRNIESNELLLLKKFSEYSGFKNVVNIIEVIEGQNSEYFVIMEYANKGDLRKYLEKNNQMNSQQRKQIILQIAQGLGELHQQNLVHRNISPENILVFQSNEQNSQVQYKLTDFCYLQDKNISKTTNIGTPYYMAPELLTDFNNKQNYKQEVDIWALGCIYFEIITGVCLFNGNSQDELFKKIKDAKQSWIDSQIDQLSKYNIIEREQKLLKLMISIYPNRRPKIFEVIQTLYGSEDFISKQAQNQSQVPDLQQQQPFQIYTQNQTNPDTNPQKYPITIINNNPIPVISLQQQTQNLEQQQKNLENKIKKEYEDRLKNQEENLKRQLQQDLKKQQEELEKEFQQKQFKNNEERQKQEQILKQYNQQLQEESDKKLKDYQEQSKKQMQEEMDRYINESKSYYENQKKQLESQIQKFQQTLNKQIDSYKQEYNQFANQIQEVEKQLNEFHIKNSKIQEEYGKLKEYFETKQIDVNNMSQSQDSTQISQNIEAIKEYNKQLNEFIQNIKLKIQQEQSEQKQNELEQELIIKQEQIQKEYQDKLKEQEEKSKKQMQEEKQKTEFHNEAQLYLSYIEDLRNKISSKNQLFIKDYEINFIISGQQIIEKYSNKIQELTNQPQPNQSHIQNIQENRKQMQLEYESLSITLIQEANKENEKLMKQVTEEQESYNQAFQTEKDNVKKRIYELEKMSIQSEELKNQLIKIKSQFNQDIVPFEQIGRNNISQQQFTTIFQQLSQLNLQCTDLEYKIKLEVDQLKYTNQANEAKQNQCKELQQKKEGVEKSINEMKTQNQELSQKLNGIKSQFQSNFPQMEQQNYITFTTQQIQEKIDFLNQLNQSCVELKAKIEMEAQQIKKQLEYVKQEFQQELQAQVQKIQDLQNKATSIDPSLQKDIETITKKIKYQQQQINEYYGQDTDEQRITNIRNAKQSNMTEYNSIIEKLQASSSLSNQANLYFNQVLSNYRSKLDKVIDTVTLRLSQIKQNLTELQQIKSKTIEINILIQNLTQYQQQYEGQLYKYQQSKQKQFDQTQLEYIQAEYEQVIQEQGQIETESRSSYNLYSQTYQYFGQHFMNVFTASKTQLENEQIKKKEKMNGIIANFLQENITIKTKEECKKILDENIEQINNDFQQYREQVDVMLKQNPREQKSFSDFDKGLREIDKQVGNISEYTQKLKESEQKELESFEDALKYTPYNQKNYTMNKVKLRAKIKDQALIRKILQMKDQQTKNEEILKKIMQVFEEIKERILKSLQK